ncbi:MAG: rhomboid family intramembrane serine protease [Gemmatimonadaceae bacterium]|nr:rhomboid family intramembrane serine protease [Gemmatimonadaceae bacterium]
MPFTDESDRPSLTRGVQWLIAINVAIYFLQLTVVGAPNMLGALGFQAGDFSQSWWTIGTYMFVHAGFWHLALNMYTLYVFGPRVERSWSTGEFAKFYLVSGLGGWLFHLIFAREALLVGASAAVFGVTLAYAMQWPDDEVLLFGVIPLKVKWMVALLVGINLIAGMASGGGGSGVAYAAHLGGIAAAWLYLRSSGTGASLGRLRQRVSSVPDQPDESPRAIPRSTRGAREQRGGIDEIVARSNASMARRPSPEPPMSQPKPSGPRELDLNSVLDKISQHGLESLTSGERRLLEERSRELRGE